MFFQLVKLYSKLYEFIHDNFHINIRGLGFLISKISKDNVINMKDGSTMYFSSKISLSYPIIINGKWGEKETHSFVNNIIDSDTIFIDIGANIGEMVNDFSQEASQCFAFEPSLECFRVLQVNKIINKQENTIIENIALSDSCGEVYLINDGTPQASISDQKSENSNPVQKQTVDLYFESFIQDFINKTVVVLVDVEGHEVNVLNGGLKFIAQIKPIIIFEFNTISREYFSLDEVEKLLPNDYELFRLNGKGKLDKNFNKTWNCVAVPSIHRTKVCGEITEAGMI